MVVVRSGGSRSLLVATLWVVLAGVSPAGAAELALTEGWGLQSSAKITEKGEVLSSAGYQPKDWYTVSVPTTVVAALVASKVYPDPYFGMNIRSIPGTKYDVATNFSNFPMPRDSPFAVPWWYRKQFRLPPDFKGKTVWLSFAGLNYRANVWLNGKRVAGADEVAGAWRTFELNVTEAARPGATNVLAVEVFAQTETDLGITFVDWNPLPPDKNLGLWRGVSVRATGPVSLRHPTVITQLNSPANDRAQLTVTALLVNGTGQAVKGKLKGRIGKVAFEQEVALGPAERKDVTFEPERFPALVSSHPKLWWPAQMGTPHLEELQLDLEVAGKSSDHTRSSFGIREIRSQIDENKSRVFFVNGKAVLIRGAGWSTDMMMRDDPARVEDELRYVLDMGLNTVRLEGKLESDHFFEVADRQGILIMAGWCCCDYWEEWAKWKPADHLISAESTRDQLYRLRAHPSVFAWLNASDNPPPRKVEQRYLQVAAETRWATPVISSASAKPAEHSGASGLKMTGPYDWVPPKYWLEDSKNGGAFGFNSETGPGPAVPPIESLRKMLPPDKLWPINEVWNFHAGGQAFKQMNIFVKALEARYGKASSAEDFAFKSQLMTYEGTRAMFEAFSRNKYQSTGVIHWMLNNAWPGLIWHLYDYYLRPAGGYFGAKRALEPVHPMYSYLDGTISVVNSRYQEVKGIKLGIKVYNLDLTEKLSRQETLDLPADTTKNVFTLPTLDGLSPTYFVRLTVHDTEGKLLGSNFYWLSTKAETLAYQQTQWFVTPAKSLADFQALGQLPKVALKVQSRSEHQGPQTFTRVTVENPGKSLAFFIRLKVNGAGGEEALPVLWQDNYFSLFPGEKREVTAEYRTRDLGGAKPVVEVSGWNVK
jgi:exo-1,4-beta-D-glucosaminidase